MVTGVSDSPAVSVPESAIGVSGTELARLYLGADRLPCRMDSPLRNDDHRQSFSIRESGGKVFWKDFGTGDGGDIIGLVARLWSVSRTDAVRRIWEDTSGGRVTARPAASRPARESHPGSSLSVRTRPWRKEDADWWGQFGIGLDMCGWCDVHPASTAFLRWTEDGVEKGRSFPLDRLAYAYFSWKDGRQYIKLYQPLSKKMKWLSKAGDGVWDLWRQAFWWASHVSRDSLVITSSRKDAMCLWSALKVPAVSMQGEGYIPDPADMEELRRTFRTVRLWYDNDCGRPDGRNPGQEDAARLTGLYPWLSNILIPDSYGCKDPSDLVKAGYGWALRLIWDSAMDGGA